MKAPAGELVYKRLRAPALSGSSLLDPPLPTATEVLRRNVEQFADAEHDVQGRPLRDLRTAARSDVWKLARQYTGQYRDLPGAQPATGLVGRPLVVSGHQPWLFHAGVWFKTFVLSKLAHRVDGDALNLIIDNDLCPTPTIAVPSGSRTHTHLRRVPLDRHTSGVPFEQRTIIDEDTFSAFGQSVAEAISPLVTKPLITPLWREAQRAVQQTANLGQRLAQARHQLEASWDLNTLEIPLSTICQTESFGWFAAHLLANLRRFSEIHNRALSEYRLVNRVRSRSHPVPDLRTQDDWFETPFWVWTNQDPRRRALLARSTIPGLELSDHHHFRQTLQLDTDRCGIDAVHQLQELSTIGVKIRPRALTTTMFSRLFLADLFIHGIGGAKYDQLTDLLITRFLRIPPPAFLAATATAWLPVIDTKSADSSLRSIDRQLRDLRFHAEHYVEPGGEAQPWIEEKKKWLHVALPRGQRGPRHRGIEKANAALQPYVKTLQTQLFEQRQRSLQQATQEQILASREHAFCLFPETSLRPLLGQLADSDR